MIVVLINHQVSVLLKCIVYIKELCSCNFLLSCQLLFVVNW